MKQSETIEHLPKVSAQPYTLFLRFSPKSVIPLERREEREHCFSNAQRGIPLSLPIPLPRWGVVETRKTT